MATVTSDLTVQISVRTRWFHEPVSWVLAVACAFGWIDQERAVQWLLDHSVVIEVR